MEKLLRTEPSHVLQRVVLFGDSWFERFERNNGLGPFVEHVRSCADQVDVCAVGGDKVCNALWRSGEGGAVEALGAAARASKTDAFILGSNSIAILRFEKILRNTFVF